MAQSKKTFSQYMEETQRLALKVAAVTNQIEEERLIPREITNELADKGFFRLLLPESLGGAELDHPSFLRIVYEFAKVDASTGWCINQNNVFSTNSILTSLNKMLRSSKKISLELNKELSSIQVKEKLATISFADGKSISSRLLVGADGINSTLRKLANIKTRTWSYNQIAYFALLKTEKFHSNTAWQTFTPTGPIAFLPFDIKGKPNISLVWSAEKTFASELQLLQDKEFINKFENPPVCLLYTSDAADE